MFPFVVPSSVAEGIQPAELGWGSHELALPADGRRHTFGKKYVYGGGRGRSLPHAANDSPYRCGHPSPVHPHTCTPLAACTHLTLHRSAIYLSRPGASVKVRSWTPEEKHYHGFLITHDESISISEYFTVPREGDDGSHPMYVLDSVEAQVDVL
jgi:homospermidine synthase